MSNHDAELHWIDIAAHSDLGYDQGQRMSFLDLQNHRIRPHSETDCSALVAGVIDLAGYPISLAAPVYTGSLRSKLTSIGWKAIPVRGMSVAQIQALARHGGEVLLNETHHVIVQSRSIGSWLSANIDERGMASGGRAGNQTGAEVSLRHLWMYHAGWDFLLIAPDAGSTSAAAVAAAASTPAQDLAHFLSPSDVKLLQKALGAKVDGIVGPQTIGAFETRAGFSADGRLDTPSATVQKVQHFLNRFVGKGGWCTYAHLAEDGIMGPATGHAISVYLNAGRGAFTGLAA